MAPTLGKRKRRAPEVRVERRESSAESMESEDGGEEDAQVIFKRHFEARFAPLPAARKAVKEVEVEEVDEEESGEDTDWEGISEAGDDGSVEVVEHTAYKAQIAAMSKSQLKAFMTSKPPSSATAAGISASLTASKLASTPQDDTSESANLKHDLALQRLLAESHLLDSSASPTLSGTNRHKATDLRLQALGSKKSILTQEKMPASHRRGIVAKKSEREDTRRREARENGIILEKATSKLDAKGARREGGGKRDRGVGGPGVGRFSGGTLTLSKKDIFDIEGPRKSVGGRGGRGGSSRGRGGGGKRGRS